MKKGRAKRLGPPVAVRFVAATGSPISDEKAQVYGAELLRLATVHRVSEIRSLDKRTVFAEVEQNPESPLRDYYQWDVNRAARAHWLEQTAKLIRSIRTVTISAGKMQAPQPLFICAEAPVRDKDRVQYKNRHVVRDDALRSDPAFRSAVGKQIRSIQNALGQLEGFTSGREPPAEVARLRDSIRRALDTYLASIADDKAA